MPASLSQARAGYLKFLKQFDHKQCTRADEKEFDRLAKARRKLTNYVPELSTGELDIETIQKGLPELDKKWNWLIQTRTRLRALKVWPKRSKVFRPLDETIEQLLKLKEQRYMWGDKSRKTKNASKKLLKQLRDQYEHLVGELFFFQGFGYPVDHLKQRQLYDEYNMKDPKRYRQKANAVMFLRQLQEDGTYNHHHENPDYYLRTTLNTLSVRLKDQEDWLDEDVRHDLEWALRMMNLELRHGKSTQLRRIQGWINRTAKARRFYRNLINKEGTHEELQEFVNKREASRKLKAFAYAKNAEVYKYLLGQDDFTQAYYVFDQILLHEVGQATSANFRDRQDIAQVVINSRYSKKLSTISKGEDFYRYLVDAGVSEKQLSTPSWLNTLFKGLRFSFTLYYIPAVKYIFCPDFYRTARETRRKNLYLIETALKTPAVDFKAVRYFSRWSMLGRIDISTVWSGYEQVPERAGGRYKYDKGLRKKFSAKKYRYLYTFEDPKKQTFHVLEMGPKTYAVRVAKDGTPSFFAYRDRHQFRFFVED